MNKKLCAKGRRTLWDAVFRAGLAEGDIGNNSAPLLCPARTISFNQISLPFPKLPG